MRFEYADARMPVAMTIGGLTYYLAYDQIGSPKIIADAAGNVVKQIDYDSFGNIIDDSNPAFDIPFGFAGGLYDNDTGLVRFGYRDYDPDVGRWTAKDPIFFAGGDTDLFGYCLNDPVNFVDPWGLTSAGHLDWFSRSLSSTGGVPSGAELPLLTPQQREASLTTLKNFLDNLSNLTDGPNTTILLPREVIEKILEDLSPLKPGDAEAAPCP